MITPIELLNSRETANIVALKLNADKLQADAAYNLFTLSTYNSHLENFHSDILASLLSPAGLHGEGSVFLELFFQYLNKYYNTAINIPEYKDVEVVREKGKLDIWIRDRHSQHSIIIENKMNDAGDMEEQIRRYYDFAIGNKYYVDAIIYLSLDGLKKAPLFNEEITKLVRNVGAFTNQPEDLVSGWLEPCRQASKGESSRSLIFQYIKQIKHLNSYAMSEIAMQAFYEYISSHENHSAAKTVNQLSAEIGTYRRDQFHKKWNNDIAPFKRIHRLVQYGNCGSLFEDFYKDQYNFKLDVYFENNGSALVRLWLPHAKHDNEKGRDECFRILKEAGMDDGFDVEYPGRGNSMVARTFLFNEGDNMRDIDAKVYDFVKALLNKLALLKDK